MPFKAMPFKVIITSPLQFTQLLQVDAPQVLERYDRVEMLQIMAHLQGDNVENYTAIVDALQSGYMVELEHAPNVTARYVYQINAHAWFVVPY